MTYRFTARAATTETDPDGYFTEAALGEGEDGSGFVLMFMAGEEGPDDQEAALGCDTHCLVTAGQARPTAAYAKPSWPTGCCGSR
ncbi:hypothetical protein [Streptomyces sp. BBFR102]|uniref:hypothetical protein n=1 Tax=Streptomyces sp. BBFR102 TaxID=3448171 RepID=UPI003F53A83A